MAAGAGWLAIWLFISAIPIATWTQQTVADTPLTAVSR
jgi:hypothetical protein